jgi:acetyl/propionyl-CoA carboxylase alpha subunit
MEEAPSPSIDDVLRRELTSAAVKIATSMNYRNAGTIEFLLDQNGQFYFLEMNTRIQVEHPVTEMITNTDLVAMQLFVAAGNPLSIKQEDIQISGHAIEVRLCAEDAENNFKPSAGKLLLWQIPDEETLRIETFVKEGLTISPNYDSLLAKLVVWSDSRKTALDHMQQTLSQSGISGIHTNLSFLLGLVESEVIRDNKIYTSYLDENLDSINQQIQEKKGRIDKHKLVIAYLIFHFQQKKYSGNNIWNQIGFWRIVPQFEVLVEGEKFECRIESQLNSQLFLINQQEYPVLAIQMNGNLLELAINQGPETFYCVENETETCVVYKGFSFLLRSNQLLKQAMVIRKNEGTSKIFQNLITADLFGKVLKINIKAHELVKSGQILLTLESMKTEIHVLSPSDARVKKVHVKAGDAVVEKQLLVELEAPSNSITG